MRRVLCLVAQIAFVSAGAPAQTRQAADRPVSAPAHAALKTNISYAAAKPLLEALREDLLPAELRARPQAELESAWPGWVSQHDAAIRARLERGDEDSIVNFLFFGTTFTKLPRATERDIAQLGTNTTVVQGRLEDLVSSLASPGANQRLQFARQVVERRGIDAGTEAGKRQVRRYLEEAIKRVLAETEAYDRTIESAKLLNNPSAEFTLRSSLYRDRGLSSDTSMFPDFAIEQALEGIKSRGMLGVGSVRRVAVVGPGLDFANRRNGYDFYPQQTIQPFAVIDSLRRLGLAKPDEFRMFTFDLSPRVNRHLEAARKRAHAGGGYVLHLPQDTDAGWTPALVRYWERFGDQIGEAVKAAAPPPGGGNVEVRAVRVRPAVVMSVIPLDLNIVMQRLAPLTADDRFDLIVATNILVYYDVFEQSLALANVAAMLRPGGFFLSNNALAELPTTPIKSVDYTHVAYTGRQDSGDDLIWYQRQ